MNLVLSVSIEDGVALTVDRPGEVFNGVIVLPDLAPTRAISGLYLRQGYEEIIDSVPGFVVVKDQKIFARNTYVYNDSQTKFQLYLSDYLAFLSPLVVQFWSY